jgi:hypothetical protein
MRDLVPLGMALSLAVLALAGCNAIDSVREGFAHSQAVSAELARSLRMKSLVGYNWHNGSLTSVNITFEGVPKDRSLAEIAEESRRAVLKEFKQAPQQIIVAFSIRP